MAAAKPVGGTQTSLQSAIVRFGAFLTDTRLELGRREYDTLVDILTVKVARLNADRLHREERPS